MGRANSLIKFFSRYISLVDKPLYDLVCVFDQVAEKKFFLIF